MTITKSIRFVAGFFLMELLVTINQVAIIMGMQVPAPQVVRKP